MNAYDIWVDELKVWGQNVIDGNEKTARKTWSRIKKYLFHEKEDYLQVLWKNFKRNGDKDTFEREFSALLISLHQRPTPYVLA